MKFCGHIAHTDPSIAGSGHMMMMILVMGVQLKRHNFGRWESFLGLVDISRMCLLYVSFGGGRTVLAL